MKITVLLTAIGIAAMLSSASGIAATSCHMQDKVTVLRSDNRHTTGAEKSAIQQKIAGIEMLCKVSRDDPKEVIACRTDVIAIANAHHRFGEDVEEVQVESMCETPTS